MPPREVPESEGGPTSLRTRGQYLDGKLPHGVLWALSHVLDLDAEGPVGLLLCGPVVDTLLGGGSRESGARAEMGAGTPTHTTCGISTPLRCAARAGLS